MSAKLSEMSIVEIAREGMQYEAEEAEHKLRAAFESMREALRESQIALREAADCALTDAADNVVSGALRSGSAALALASKVAE